MRKRKIPVRTKILLSLFLATVVLAQPRPACAGLENFMDADVVIGQPDFTTGTAGATRSKFGNSNAVSMHRGRLFVCDTQNHRILIFNSVPRSNGAPADLVLGQPDFVSNTRDNGGVHAGSLDTPSGICFAGNKMIVADVLNNRVLIWDSVPETNFAPANTVVGQPGPDSDDINQGGTPTAQTLYFPRAVATDGTRLFVADEMNYRVLIYNQIPATNNAAADVVLGQRAFTTRVQAVSDRDFDTVFGVHADGRRLFVSDGGNRRVLIYDPVPETSHAPADVVLGQTDFFSNRTKLGADGFSGSLRGVFSDGRRLFAADVGANRVLVWDSIPTENAAPADFVLGQPSFKTNFGENSRRRMNQPDGVFSDGLHVFVAEWAGRRVLTFNIGGSAVNLGPQFRQGKAVLGKVYEDKNRNGYQDAGEKGIPGVRVAADTGVYAITDEDGKYHFPYIETGQHLLKLDPATLTSSSRSSTGFSRKLVVTEGVLSKVSFGVYSTEGALIAEPEGDPDGPMLKVSVSQDPAMLKKYLEIRARQTEETLVFEVDTNYALFIKRAEILIFDRDFKRLHSWEIPVPLEGKVELPVSFLKIPANRPIPIHYQLSVYDEDDNEDRVAVGSLEVFKA